jgi:hypothetical protein
LIKALVNTILSFRARCINVCAIALLCLSIQVHAVGQTRTSEYNVKAAFLYNFAQFVEWPVDAFRGETPFVIGILGDDPFGSFLDQTVSGEKVKGRPIIIQRYRDLKDIRNCHILFITSKEADRIKDILPLLARKNTLTVSDHPFFAKAGGMIRFMTRDNKIKLQINPTAAKAVDLNISSKLLRVAEIVETAR